MRDRFMTVATEAEATFQREVVTLQCKKADGCVIEPTLLRVETKGLHVF
jgi:hypothetical protein